jgi:UDP-glucose 4-epimerase
MDLKNKKILITGGAGFIGSNTANALLNAGADVVIVDNLSAFKQKNTNPSIKFYDIDISSPELEEVFKKENLEIVYHFAFNVSIHKSLDIEVGKSAISADKNLLNICQKYSIKKFIYASSGAVYGNPTNLPVNETGLIDPAPHVIAKSETENEIRFFNKNYGLKYVILRYATVYGPGQVSSAMSDYIRVLSSGGQADIFGDGTNTRDYVYIDDVVKANLLALSVPDNFKDPVFNVSTGVETTLNKLYCRIAEILKKECKPRYLESRPGELIRYQLDYTKIKNVLGWEPEYDLERGLNKRLKEENLI